MSYTKSRLGIYEVTEDYTVGRVGPILVIAWRSPPTIQSFRRIDTFTQKLVSEYESGIGIVVVIEPENTTPPSQAARAENVKLAEKYATQIRANATVLQGTTVKHSMIRFLLSTIHLMSPSKTPNRIFDSVNPAALWLSQLFEEVTADQVRDAIQHARATSVELAAPMLRVAARR